jgi:predicted RNA-binding protein associated with RNAse of E/G family
MLNPATIALIIQGFQAAIAAAPQVEALAVKAKDYVTSLFESGLISKETQDAIHAHVDAISAAAKAGSLPPEWSVEADPS